MAKLVARLRATAALLGSNPDISQKYKWATYAKDGPTHSSPPKKYTKKVYFFMEERNVYASKLSCGLVRIRFRAYPGLTYLDNKHLYQFLP
jgi:hypothetical protein